MMLKNTDHSEFYIEEKTSGGAVFERGVRQSKEHKAIRRIAEPLMKKHWKNAKASLQTFSLL